MCTYCTICTAMNMENSIERRRTAPAETSTDKNSIVRTTRLFRTHLLIYIIHVFVSPFYLLSPFDFQQRIFRIFGLVQEYFFFYIFVGNHKFQVWPFVKSTDTSLRITISIFMTSLESDATLLFFFFFFLFLVSVSSVVTFV